SGAGQLPRPDDRLFPARRPRRRDHPGAASRWRGIRVDGPRRPDPAKRGHVRSLGALSVRYETASQNGVVGPASARDDRVMRTLLLIALFGLAGCSSIVQTSTVDGLPAYEARCGGLFGTK